MTPFRLAATLLAIPLLPFALHAQADAPLAAPEAGALLVRPFR